MDVFETIDGGVTQFYTDLSAIEREEAATIQSTDTIDEIPPIDPWFLQIHPELLGLDPACGNSAAQKRLSRSGLSSLAKRKSVSSTSKSTNICDKENRNETTPGGRDCVSSSSSSASSTPSHRAPSSSTKGARQNPFASHVVSSSKKRATPSRVAIHPPPPPSTGPSSSCAAPPVPEESLSTQLKLIDSQASHVRSTPKTSKEDRARTRREELEEFKRRKAAAKQNAHVEGAHSNPAVACETSRRRSSADSKTPSNLTLKRAGEQRKQPFERVLSRRSGGNQEGVEKRQSHSGLVSSSAFEGSTLAGSTNRSDISEGDQAEWHGLAMSENSQECRRASTGSTPLSDIQRRIAEHNKLVKTRAKH